MAFEIKHGDCLEVMRGMADNSVDAIVMDPPYCAGAVSEAQRTRAAGQGLRSENISRFGWFTGDNMGTAGLVFLLRAITFEATRIVKPSGSMVVFCDWRMFASIQPAIESAGVRFQNLIVWDKGHMGLGTGFRARHELALHFTFGAPQYHDKGTANVIVSKRVNHTERQHQTQKPVDLMEQITKVVAPIDGLVLDPFCGSGSTGVACMNVGRKFIGIEREAEYVAIAEARIVEAQRQLGLFA